MNTGSNDVEFTRIIKNIFLFMKERKREKSNWNMSKGMLSTEKFNISPSINYTWNECSL